MRLTESQLRSKVKRVIRETRESDLLDDFMSYCSMDGNRVWKGRDYEETLDNVYEGLQDFMRDQGMTSLPPGIDEESFLKSFARLYFRR